jgi:N-acetyl-anhydromuramyl-L-alanine amidase AmpD
MAAHNIPPRNITTHAIVSPGRKDDIGPEAWKQMRDALNLP